MHQGCTIAHFCMPLHADIEVALGKPAPGSAQRMSQRGSLDMAGVGHGLAGMVRASRGSLDLGSGALAGIVSTSGALGSGGRATPHNGVAEGKGMVLPFLPLALTFHNLCYYVDLPKARAALLQQQTLVNLPVPLPAACLCAELCGSGHACAAANPC
jgi:hypothetical protein